MTEIFQIIRKHAVFLNGSVDVVLDDPPIKEHISDINLFLTNNEDDLVVFLSRMENPD